MVNERLTQELPTGQRYSRDEASAAYQKVYTELGHPEWLDPIRR